MESKFKSKRDKNYLNWITNNISESYFSKINVASIKQNISKNF